MLVLRMDEESASDTREGRGKKRKGKKDHHRSEGDYIPLDDREDGAVARG